ncbi:MAG: CTP synthase [Chitinophagales bacterium]|nr:CTP synthase [Chitinophagales bacterium]
MAKYIFVTGGVTSSLGKGILAASLSRLLKSRGYRVTIQKFDPYINVNAGTINPFEHGECYVTNDGHEADLDLGHYERFLDTPTSKENNITTGRIYLEVIKKERAGDFKGKTVQIVPHITDEVKRRMLLLGKNNDFDIIVTEIGGTVGDIESLPFIEAIRQLKWELPAQDFLEIHLTLIPYLSAAQELKTKPTQHSVKALQSYGVQPDILICRTEHELKSDTKRKIANFCNVSIESVIEMRDVETIYDVPLSLLKEKLDTVVLNKLGYQEIPELNLSDWKKFIVRHKNPKKQICLGLVGKYVEMKDAYLSIYESLIHAGAENSCRVSVKQIHANDIHKGNVEELLSELDGILVAPGYGDSGIEGKIEAVEYARTHCMPFLGIGLGMQCAAIEFARNILKMADANSNEFDKNTQHAIFCVGQNGKNEAESTERLGAFACELREGSKISKAYGKNRVDERHKHSQEFNKTFLSDFESAGMIASGINPERGLVEAIELVDHPWFIGVLFRPEFKSTILNPHALYVNFVKAMIDYKEKR